MTTKDKQQINLNTDAKREEYMNQRWNLESSKMVEIVWEWIEKSLQQAYQKGRKDTKLPVSIHSQKEKRIVDMLPAKDGYLYRVFTDGSWDRYIGEEISTPQTEWEKVKKELCNVIYPLPSDYSYGEHGSRLNYSIWQDRIWSFVEHALSEVQSSTREEIVKEIEEMKNEARGWEPDTDDGFDETKEMVLSLLEKKAENK